MSLMSAKSSRLRLAPKLYEDLRREVLCRDGWRCQNCGAMSNLEVHHREFAATAGTIQSKTSLHFAVDATQPCIV